MTTHRVLDQTITMPVAVRDASAATIIYDVDPADARRLAPRGFEVLESQPGRARFVRALIDYRDNDLGACRGRPHAAAFTQGGPGALLQVGVLLGDRPVAAEPAGLGLPSEPVSTVWIEKTHGSFQEPRPLAGERVASRGTESGR